ncbi:hypothetical protein T12_4803 [Trichinella patagoniensis]|uniref:Uncharacterized protein n=1 Tax=Trichinella patagoniensis TaxID=990121 RepID=A0A0V0ZXR2_9BILA|nr:hypothetical protein T12_4803 [Trichinella patagoniensis]
MGTACSCMAEFQAAIEEEQPVKEQGASAFRLIYHYSRLWPPAMHLAFVPMRHGFSLTNV